MGREFELKYAAKAADLEAIGGEFPCEREFSMATTYYDNAAGDLSRLRWTLRRRLENGVSVCTVKTPTAGLGRGEWETECGSIEAAIPALCALGAPGELIDLTAGGVEEVCGARFVRRAGLVEAPGCTVEIALDRGVLLGGGRELPFTEVEVELKDGSENAAIAFAQALAAKYGLTHEKKSKYRRALDLAKGD